MVSAKIRLSEECCYCRSDSQHNSLVDCLLFSYLCRKKRSIDVQFVQETPGGYISVIEVKNFKAITNHRIVVRLCVGNL